MGDRDVLALALELIEGAEEERNELSGLGEAAGESMLPVISLSASTEGVIQCGLLPKKTL